MTELFRLHDQRAAFVAMLTGDGEADRSWLARIAAIDIRLGRIAATVKG